MKHNVTVSFDEEKLSALKIYLQQKDKDVESELTSSLELLYEKAVPANVRNYIELKASSSTSKKTSAQKPKKEKVETQPVLSE
ncbi:MAG: hypothetical protein IJO20_08675 [Ruminococcus sp.]|nr:hypothetical protein [Ruminococcus sp.]